MNLAVVTFTLYLVLTTALGYYGYLRYKRKGRTMESYALGGRSVRAYLMALSEGASTWSGWIAVSFPALLYAGGLCEAWWALCYIGGEILGWSVIAKRLARYSRINGAISVPEFIERRSRDDTKLTKSLSAMAILIFFIFYAAGNLKAGMITFEQCFHMPGFIALIIIAVLCAAYTAGGGYLSTIYTGILQAILMLVFAIVVPIVALSHAGGIGGIVSAVEPAKLEIFGGEILSLGGGLGAIALGSLMVNWWFGYFGQPHVLVRYMGIEKPGEVNHAILVSGLFMTILSMGGILLGLSGMALEPGLENPDLLTPTLINTLLPPWLGGLMIAGILAAIMSSVAAFLQVSSTAVSEDLLPSFREISNKKRIWIGRVVVVVVTIIASGVAYSSPMISHWVMTYGWMGLAATFGPTILLSLYWKGMNKWGAISGITIGLVVTLLWICYLQWICIATGPAFVSSLIAIIIVSKLTGGPAKEWKDEVTKEMEDINRPLKE